MFTVLKTISFLKYISKSSKIIKIDMEQTHCLSIIMRNLFSYIFNSSTQDYKLGIKYTLVAIGTSIPGSY